MCENKKYVYICSPKTTVLGRENGASPPPATEKERCRSGRSGRTRNAVYGQLYRGFESLSLRKESTGRMVGSFFLIRGKVQEWLNWPAWKASKPLKGFRGSNPLLSAACENRVASDLAARFLLRFRVSRRGFSGRGAPSLSRARRRAVPRRLRSASTRRSACGRAGGRTRAGWRRAVSARSGCTAAV